MNAFGLSFRPSENQLHISDDTGAIRYSDGETEETQLFEAISSATDLSATSWELQNVITSWAQRYHLSIHRGAIVRCLPFSSNLQVLELGAGCGAVTRALGEKFAMVDAIEGSTTRARICASRCRDLPNVRVFAADINKLVPRPKYDIVFLVGVLEWSKGYLDADNPFQACLQLAARALKENGVLIIAIENQLGLKYFLGIGEDHCGVELEGLHGYPTFRHAETFSKAKLCRLLSEIGLRAIRFLYPFPDYKLAKVILTDDAASLHSEAIAYWASRYQFEDYLRPERRVCGHQALITSEVTKAGLLGELSNSLLVMAAVRDSSLPCLPWVVWSERLARREIYSSHTTLEIAGDALVVRKSHPYVAAKQHVDDAPFRLNSIQQEPFLDGCMLELEMVRMAMAGDKDRFFQAIAQWLAYMENYLLKDDRVHLRPEAWDCIPRNLIQMKDGTLRAFDLEFMYHEPLSNEDLCTRGLLWWHLDNLAWVAPLNPNGRTVRDHIVWALTQIFSKRDPNTLIARAIEREDKFQTLLGFTDAAALDQMLNEPRKEYRVPEQRLFDVEAELQRSKVQLDRLKNHIVVGRVISTWRRLFNPNLP
jgi:SAM-dependent methyltransferase